jgi:hypothetical protein
MCYVDPQPLEKTMKILLSLAVYASIILVVVHFVANGSVVDSLEQLGSFLNGKSTE